MFILGLVGWWYGQGWRGRVVAYRNGLTSALDYFSIDLLLRTFFSPYRQISTGQVRGSLNVQIHAFFDRIISRAIGAGIRLVMIMIGLIAIIGYMVIGAMLVVVWAMIPLMPIVGVSLTAVGWIPWIK